MVQFNVPNCFSNDCDCAGTPPPGNFCPYGDCFSCVPSKCSGPKCCCCSSIDIVFDIRARCYDRVYFSCNIDGTSPGPGEDDFPAECTQCFDACDRAMGGAAACISISQHIDDPTWDPSPPNWYTFPPDIGPCECNCEEFQDQRNPGAGCNLTCVTCDGLRCNAHVEVTAGSCSYQFDLTPSTACCGTPALTDVVFAIDYSVSMGPHIASVKAAAGAFAEGMELTGAQVRFGLLIYGRDSSCSPGDVIVFQGGKILTTDVDEFKTAMETGLSGGAEPDFAAAGVALQTYPWVGVENILFVIGDELIDSDCGPPTGDIGAISNPLIRQPSAAVLSDLANALGVRVFTVQPFGGGIGVDTRKTDFSTNTSGGQDLDISLDFSSLLDDLNLNVFGASCDCLDSTPIPVELCKGGTGPQGDECIDPDVNIPIGICVEEDNSDCGICNEPLAFNVCGEIVIVEPDPETVNLVCCGELEGGGCTCPTKEFPPEGCCGIACSDIDICNNFDTLEQAINNIWCECWNKTGDGATEEEAFILETPDCTSCENPEPDNPNFDAIINCVIKVPDGAGGYVSITRPQIVAEVEAAWAACEEPDEKPPPSISEASCLPECDRQDECVVGSPDCGETDIRDCRKIACSDAHKVCTSVRNPDTVILNNGIGLVAYESMEDISVIKIEQFNTSLPAKVLPNRRTNYGRLQHTLRWEDGDGDFKLVKLYYFEPIPSHFFNGVSGPPPEGSLTDIIVFRNGPFQNQCFSLDINPVGPVEGETDEVGNFIRFIVPDDITLSNDYPSIDDVYNIEWFIIDSDDTGLTGSVKGATIPGSEFLLNRDNEGENAVNIKLELSPHIHNGKPAPVAYPSLAVAHNYMNAVENSHYVYVVYQALEDQKWNLYMRQLRLSEYSREEAIASGATVPLQDLGITELVYRAVCVTDECEAFGNDFLTKRIATFEVALQDGREVFNQDLLGSAGGWPVCPGEPAGSFLKKKAIMEFTHSAVVNRCPDQFEFNEIFYNWEVGDEFSVPFTELTSADMFIILKKPNDNAIPLGENTTQVSGVTVTSSQVAAIWYEDPSSQWGTPNDVTFQDMLQYKGLDVSEPMPITEFEESHCTHPVVSVNTNNEVFVIYECTDPQVHQIHITGTVIPSTSFPLGVFSPKNLDANLDYFLSPSDFKYRNAITLSGDGINQLPDIHIDVNDVIHIAWQSNRDDYWEIYYANSEEQFKPKRITDFKSKSLKPSITGDVRGNLHIVWHDNRFGNWEIMMAYRDDERVLTLLEQDPYLAGVRNTGYQHSTDVIPLILTNPSGDDVLCISSLFVRFFNDRLLTVAAFDVLQSAFPMAFQIPGSEADVRTISIVYPEFNTWLFASFILGVSRQRYTSDPPIDTGLELAVLKSFSITFDGFKPTLLRLSAGSTAEIAENVSLLPRDTRDGTGTHFIDISNIESGEEIFLDSLTHLSVDYDLETIIGRYIQIKLYADTAGPHDLAGLIELKLNVERSERVCLAPEETITGFLDVTPFIRVDKEGNETVEIPIPVGINKNQTYFIAVIAIQDNGQLFVFDDQKRSISCETCVNDASPWDSASCTYSVIFLNAFSEQETKFANARVRFYTDQTQTNLVAQFDAFEGVEGELECFTTDANQPAQDEWTDAGLKVLFGKTRAITLWPMLSNTSGLLCGVTYWVSTEICIGNQEAPCDRLSLKQTKFESWTCNCGSPRWEERFGDAPTNIRDVVRWASSGDGFSDTRLTETGSSVSNYNPVIKLRTDLTGIVIYESNRDGECPGGECVDGTCVGGSRSGRRCDEDLVNEVHTLYGTAFSVFPRSNMYATGAQSISTTFGEVLVQSDIPITSCNGSNCGDVDAATGSQGPAMEGRNIDFVFDQYDNIFLAAEKFADQTDCADLQEDSQRSIIVHRCGIQPKNLVFVSDESGAGTFVCDASEILGKTAPLSKDKTFKKLIKLARVSNKSAKYHIVRSKKPAAVVDQCNIFLDIITEPETIAIRLKNENEAWSAWLPFDPDLGENTLNIPWVLSVGSGVKTVTIAAATYQGLSTSFSLSIVADYKGIDHTIKFYKLQGRDADVPNGTSYEELLRFLKLNDAVFAIENLLKNLENVPVAGIRQPTIITDELGSTTLIKKTEEFVFIEIIPTEEYLEGLGILLKPMDVQQKLLPTFDVLQQGAQDLFSVPTIFDETNKLFKGVFQVHKEDKTFFKDGLSFVIPHFQQDCGDLAVTLLSTDEYTRDQLNLVVPGARTAPGETVTDVWAKERENLGKIQHQIDIRGTEDPYFIFGDPNYRLKKQDE